MTIKPRTLAVVLACIAGVAAIFVRIGMYDISATDQHTRPVYALLEYGMRQSVRLRAGSIEPPELESERRIAGGLQLYRRHCLQCHGAPGIAPERFSLGLTPAPANLVITAREWQAAELYWVIKHGIKMTGMPAWEYRLSDDQIWDVVAFVKRLVVLSPEEYARQAGAVPLQPEPIASSGGGAAIMGNVDAGRRALQQYLCITCHRIPGVVGANRDVGPPLNGIGKRKYIGGIVPNTPENLVRWLQNPQQFDPQSAMPNLGVADRDARDIAAFLYTLEDVD